MVSAVVLAKCSAIKCNALDEINRIKTVPQLWQFKFSPDAKILTKRMIKIPYYGEIPMSGNFRYVPNA